MSNLTYTPYQVALGSGLRIQAQEYTGSRGVDPQLPIVVLAHGWTLTHESWEPVIEPLLDTHPVRVLTYDQPGHGDSDPITDAPSIHELGGILEEVVDAVVPDAELVVAGHSMGGMTVMAYAGTNPLGFIARVQGAVLVGTAASLEGRKPIPLEGLVMRFAASAPRIPAGPFVPTIVQSRLMFGGTNVTGEVRKAAIRQVKRTSMPTIGRFFSSLSHLDEEESLTAFATVPTHIFVGDRDRLTPVEYAEAIHRAIPGSVFHLAHGAGHLLTYEIPLQIAAVIGNLVTASRESRAVG